MLFIAAPFVGGSGSRATWLLGDLALIAGVVYLLISAGAKASQSRALEDAEFKTEPRDYDYIGVSGGSMDGETHYHEVIKVRCRYCGTLNEVATTNCIACGGVM